MIVTYEMVHHKSEGRHPAWSRNEVKEVKFCCDYIKPQWGENIDFGKYSNNYSPKIHLYFIEILGWDNDETLSYPISFCPFCGKPIECVEATKE